MKNKKIDFISILELIIVPFLISLFIYILESFTLKSYNRLMINFFSFISMIFNLGLIFYFSIKVHKNYDKNMLVGFIVGFLYTFMTYIISITIFTLRSFFMISKSKILSQIMFQLKNAFIQGIIMGFLIIMVELYLSKKKRLWLLSILFGIYIGFKNSEMYISCVSLISGNGGIYGNLIYASCLPYSFPGLPFLSMSSYFSTGSYLALVSLRDLNELAIRTSIIFGWIIFIFLITYLYSIIFLKNKNYLNKKK